MRRDINFLSVFRSSLDSGSGADRITIVGIVAVSLTIICLLGAFILARFGNIALGSKKAVLQAQLSNSTLVSAQSQVERDNKLIQLLGQYKNAADNFSSGFAKEPVFDSAVLDNVAQVQPADVTVSALRYDGGCLTLTCGCTNKASAPVFAHSLASLGCFGSVAYSGESTLGGASFTFTVSCYLKGGSSE